MITFDRDIIPTITAVSAVALDVSCSSSMDALNSFLCVTLLTAFTKEMRCFTVPLESAVNENNYAAVEKTASDMAFQAKAVKLGRKDCELSNISLVDDSSSSKRRSKWNSDEALPAVLRGEVPAQSQESTENRNRSDSFVEPEEMIFNGFPPRRSYSYYRCALLCKLEKLLTSYFAPYSDETIPISLFLTNDLGEYLQLLEESQSEQTDDGNEVDHSSSEKQAEKIKLYIYSDGSIANNSLQGKSSETSSAKLSDKSKSSAKSWESPQVDLKTGKIIDQPILFHSRKIKSSGYGQTPNNVMDRFAKMRRERLRNQRQDSHHINNLLPRSLSAPMRRHSISGESNTIGSKGMGTKIDSSGAKKLRVYPLACGAMTQQQSHHNYPVAGEKAVGIHSKHGIAPSIDGQVGSISKICFNKDGSLLAIASTDAIVSTLKLPVATNKGEGNKNIIADRLYYHFYYVHFFNFVSCVLYWS